MYICHEVKNEESRKVKMKKIARLKCIKTWGSMKKLAMLKMKNNTRLKMKKAASLNWRKTQGYNKEIRVIETEKCRKVNEEAITKRDKTTHGTVKFAAITSLEINNKSCDFGGLNLFCFF